VAPEAFERHGEEGSGIAPLRVDALRGVGRYRFGGAQALGQAANAVYVGRRGVTLSSESFRSIAPSISATFATMAAREVTPSLAKIRRK
jgi:hypothetical protein